MGVHLVSVQAHRLTLDWEVAAGVLEVRAHVGPEPAAGADVELHDATGRLLAAGTLDGTGRYLWPVAAGGPITVEVNAGLGHRRSLTVSEADLRPGSASVEGGVAAAGSAAQVPGRTSGSSETASAPVVRVGLGLTFLLALAAAWMSYRNTRRLAHLEDRLRDHEGRG